MSEILWHYLGADKQKAGPFTAKQMRELALDRTITGHTLVWCEGMANWELAAGILDLSAKEPGQLDQRNILTKMLSANKTLRDERTLTEVTAKKKNLVVKILVTVAILAGLATAAYFLLK